MKILDHSVVLRSPNEQRHLPEESRLKLSVAAEVGKEREVSSGAADKLTQP